MIEKKNIFFNDVCQLSAIDEYTKVLINLEIITPEEGFKSEVKHGIGIINKCEDEVLKNELMRHFQIAILKKLWDNHIPFKDLEGNWDNQLVHKLLKYLKSPIAKPFEKLEELYYSLIENYFGCALMVLQNMYFQNKKEYIYSQNIIDNLLYKNKKEYFDLIEKYEDFNQTVIYYNNKIDKENKEEEKRLIDNFKLQQEIMSFSKE